MRELSNVPVASHGGQTVSLPNLLRGLHQRGRLAPLLHEEAVRQVLLGKAVEASIEVSAQELQQAANRLRKRLGLSKADLMNRWLDRAHLTADDFAAVVEGDLLVARLAERVTGPHVAQHFASNTDRYARARLRLLVVADEGTGRELLHQIVDEDREFAELARQHSLHLASRSGGGSLGTCFRCQLPAAAADAIFAARPGRVVGPFPLDKGFALFLVEELTPPALDEVTTALIRSELFNAWVQSQVADLHFDWSWLETVNGSA